MCKISWRWLWQHSCHIISMRTTSMSLTCLLTALLSALRECWWGSAKTSCEQLTTGSPYFSGATGHVGYIRHINDSKYPPVNAAAEVWNWWHCPQVVSVLPVRPDSAGSAWVNHLYHNQWFSASHMVLGWTDVMHPLLSPTAGNIRDVRSRRWTLRRWQSAVCGIPLCIAHGNRVTHQRLCCWNAGHKLKMNDDETIILQVLPSPNTMVSYKGHVRPAFHVRVSAGAFQDAFPRKKKCISMHAETRLRNHGIRLVVARQFHCLHKFKVVRMRVASVWATCARKSRSSSGVSARG